MKKVLFISLVVMVLGMLVSCVTYTLPVSATGNPVGSKVGVATGSSVLGIFGSDTESGIRQAAANGGITKISTVDFSFNYGILGFVQKYTCTVTGE